LPAFKVFETINFGHMIYLVHRVIGLSSYRVHWVIELSGLWSLKP
jgi:hypothetical protein